MVSFVIALITLKLFFRRSAEQLVVPIAGLLRFPERNPRYQPHLVVGVLEPRVETRFSLECFVESDDSAGITV
jgi:hypothetical protein